MTLTLTYMLCYLSATCVTNFIQLISPQPVNLFSQTKLCWKAPNKGYLHICEMYKIANRDFTVTNDLISQLVVVAFVHPTYVQIAFIWGFPAQLGL